MPLSGPGEMVAVGRDVTRDLSASVRMYLAGSPEKNAIPNTFRYGSSVNPIRRTSGVVKH